MADKMNASKVNSGKVNVGIIGTGNIFPAYVKGCRSFGILNLIACADMDESRAHTAAQEWTIQKASGVDELLADPTIDIVINLTPPQSHAAVSQAAIAAGKHVHSEKPLALNREDGRQLLAAARAKQVRVGCAPDTFLGGGLQTCRKLIDSGAIGRPIAFSAAMLSHGPESWHPNPEFFYKVGAGPMFDMGPYYLTALINLLGPITAVTSITAVSFAERLITSEARNGQRITVDTPTHLPGVLAFESGVVGTLVTSFDVWSDRSHIEIYGEEGTLRLPDPNTFGGPVQLWDRTKREWNDVPLTHSADVGRGIGVADMAYAIRNNRPQRASGELALHVLDVMQSFEESSRSRQHVTPTTTVKRPEPLPEGLAAGQLDGSF